MLYSVDLVQHQRRTHYGKPYKTSVSQSALRNTVWHTNFTMMKNVYKKRSAVFIISPIMNCRLIPPKAASPIESPSRRREFHSVSSTIRQVLREQRCPRRPGTHEPWLAIKVSSWEGQSLLLSRDDDLAEHTLVPPSPPLSPLSAFSLVSFSLSLTCLSCEN